MSGQSLGMGLGENSAARWASLLHCHLSPDSSCYGRKWGTDKGLLPCIPSYGQRPQGYCTNKHCHGLLRNKSPCIAERIDIHQILLKCVLCPPKLPNVLHERTFLINDIPGSRGNMVKQKQMLDPGGHHFISSSLQPVWKLRGSYFQVSWSAMPECHPGTVSLSPVFPVWTDCCLTQKGGRVCRQQPLQQLM